MTEKNKKKQEMILEKELEEITADAETKLVERVDKETIKLNGSRYEIVTDYKEALDLDMLEARYSELLEKYDYIVGDISYDKLRLRGFYEDDAKRVPIDMRISSLDDYLLEYCSFGCSYFVLKRLDPKKQLSSDFDAYSKRPQKKRSRRSSRKPRAKQDTRQPKKQPKQSETSSRSKKSKTNKRDFVQKEVQSTKPKQPKEKKDVKVETVKDKKGNTRFQIRRKKTEVDKK
ncbi:YutD family protein [Atopococcus tabaci]|uniref:YutD family protein n=1 Tax=Atopococcus tabaci TaxID=269774 RepID=UPI0003F4F5C9|nr:YutD family protein [Atopococcus tabaci]